MKFRPYRKFRNCYDAYVSLNIGDTIKVFDKEGIITGKEMKVSNNIHNIAECFFTASFPVETIITREIYYGGITTIHHETVSSSYEIKVNWRNIIPINTKDRKSNTMQFS